MVNKVWRLSEMMEQEYFAHLQKVDGVAADKLTVAPFEINGVKMKGGHMQISYDNFSKEITPVEKAMNARNGVSGGRSSSSYNRVFISAKNSKPVLLDTAIIMRSLMDKVHDISYREKVNEVSHIFTDSSIKNAIIDTQGEAFYDEMRTTIIGIVNTHPHQESSTGIAKMSKYFRYVITTKHLFGSIRNTVQQFSSAYISGAEVGRFNLAKAMLEFPTAQRVALEKSAFMVQRTKYVNREATEFLKEHFSNTRGGAFLAHARKYGFAPQTYVDKLFAIPTWYAKYQQGMMKHGNEKQAINDADTSVAESVGSGAGIHLGSLMHSNNNEFIKTITVFGSWFNMYYNRVYKATKGGSDFMSMEAFEAVVVTPMLVAATMQLLVGDLPEEDESDAKYFMRVWLQFMLGTTPLIREFQSKALQEAGMIDYAFDPVSSYYSGGEAFIELFGQIGDVATGEKEFAEAAPRIIKGVGSVMPLWGSGTMARIWEGALDPDQNWWFSLVEGRDKQDRERLPFTR